MKSSYPDSATIQQYHDGLLDPEVMHQLEKQALEDPFLADALDGFAFAERPGEHLSMLQRQLHERIVHLQENKKVLDLSWQRLSVAAAAAVLFISAGILFWMNGMKSKPELASNPRQVEVSLTDPDSLLNAERPIIKAVDSTSAIATGQSRLTARNTENDAENTAATTAREAIDQPVQREESAMYSRKPASDQGETMMAQRQISANAAAVSPSNGRSTIAEPVGGWPLFEKYLVANTRLPGNAPVLKGKVVIKFSIHKDGHIEDLKVSQSLHPLYDKEALRLIKEGPKWKRLAAGNTEMETIVSF